MIFQIAIMTREDTIWRLKVIHQMLMNMKTFNIKGLWDKRHDAL